MTQLCEIILETLQKDMTENPLLGLVDSTSTQVSSISCFDTFCSILDAFRLSYLKLNFSVSLSVEPIV